MNTPDTPAAKGKKTTKKSSASAGRKIAAKRAAARRSKKGSPTRNIVFFVLPIAFAGMMQFPGGNVDADTFVLTVPMAAKQEGLVV